MVIFALKTISPDVSVTSILTLYSLGVDKSIFDCGVAIATKSVVAFLYLASFYATEQLKTLPLNLIISFILGPAENYAKLWLLEKISEKPSKYRHEFSQSAWLSVERFFITDQ